MDRGIELGSMGSWTNRKALAILLTVVVVVACILVLGVLFGTGSALPSDVVVPSRFYPDSLELGATMFGGCVWRWVQSRTLVEFGDKE